MYEKLLSRSLKAVIEHTAPLAHFSQKLDSGRHKSLLNIFDPKTKQGESTNFPLPIMKR